MANWGRFCPPAHRRPSWDLARWLWLLTPPGAPVIPVLQGDRPPPHPGCVPYLGRHIPEWPHKERNAALRAQLPGEPIARKPGTHAPRSGKLRWEVEAAFRRDINGASEGEVAQRLELTEGVDRQPEASRSARRYVSNGRRSLADIGAWPWCLAPNGRPVRNWWTQEHYLGPLARWHRLAFVRAANDLLGTVDMAVGSHDGERVSVDRWRAAEGLYADWLTTSSSPLSGIETGS